MKKRSVIQDKTYKFALRVIKVSKEMIKNNENILSKQLLRSGTSIGANVQEANGAQSRRDFEAKMFIAYKEARECRYWLNLSKDSSLISRKRARGLLNKVEEICRIIGKILSTSRKRHS